MPAQLDAYVESKVMTATAYELHLMVLEGALRHATLAEQALERKNYDKAHLAIRLRNRTGYGNAHRPESRKVAGSRCEFEVALFVRAPQTG